MVKKRDAYLAFRAPANLKKLVERFLQMDYHQNKSDFYRDAVREKIKMEAPDLYREVLGQDKRRNENGKKP